LVTITRGQEIKTKNGKAEINQLTIFNKILTTSLKDFGLKESGFSIDDIEEDDNSIIITWTPPEAAQPFLEYVVTEVKDNLLRSVLFYDVDGKAINKTFYDDYAMINGLPVPHKIKSHFKAQKEEIFKILSFSDVQIY
jgi:hypothetical protein